MERENRQSAQICFLPLGDKNLASSRLRCYAIHEQMVKRNIASRIGIHQGGDLLFIQKKADDVAVDIAYSWKRKAKTLIFDMDDFPNCQSFRKNSALILALADAVTTATPEQKSLLCDRYPRVKPEKVFCLPNPIDYGLTQPLKKIHRDTETLQVVWFGNVENLPEKVIRSVCSMPRVECHVISNFNEEMVDCYPQCRFHKWAYKSFSSTFAKYDVCVLSHLGSEISCAKNANKMVTSIAHGLPVVASFTPDYERLAELVGISEYLFRDEITLQLNLEKMRDSKARQRYIENSQGIVWDNFNVEKVVSVFNDIIDCAHDLKKYNNVSAILEKLAPFHRQMVVRKGIGFFKSKLMFE